MRIAECASPRSRMGKQARGLPGKPWISQPVERFGTIGIAFLRARRVARRRRFL
ncbi:hypothetical protein [Adlercreutzia rubneri]